MASLSTENKKEWADALAERAFLKFLFSVNTSSLHAEKESASKAVRLVKSEWFTSPNRALLFECYLEFKKHYHSAFTEVVVNEHFSEEDEKRVLTEYACIQKCKDQTDIGFLITTLEKKFKEKSFLTIIGDAASSVSKGNLDEGIKSIKTKVQGLSMVNSSHETKSFFDNTERKEYIHKKKNGEVKEIFFRTGFPTIDEQTGGFQKSEYILLAAVTGVGKSTQLKAFAKGMMDQADLQMDGEGVNILHITNEEHELQVMQKYDAVFSGVAYSSFKRATIEDEALEYWDKTLRRRSTKKSKLFIRQIPCHGTVDDIESAYFELQNKGVQIDVIIVDYLNHMMPRTKSYDINDERIKASTELKELAKGLNVVVISAAQAAPALAEKSKRGDAPGRLDIYGAKGQLFPVNLFLIICAGRQCLAPYEGRNVFGDGYQRQFEEGQSFHEKGAYATFDARQEWEKDILWRIVCCKNRDGAPFELEVRHRVKIGTVVEVAIDNQNISSEDKKAYREGAGLYNAVKEEATDLFHADVYDAAF